MILYFLRTLLVSAGLLTLVGCGSWYNKGTATLPEVIDLRLAPYKGSFVDGGLATTNLTCWPTSTDIGQALGQKSTNPGITWKGIPSQTKSFAIIIDLINNPPHADCKQNINGYLAGCVQWQIYNIDPAATAIGQPEGNGAFPEIKRTPDNFLTGYEANIATVAGSTAVMGPNWNATLNRVPLKDNPSEFVETGGKYYLGPCASGSSDTFLYRITLYALNDMIPDQNPNYTRQTFEKIYADNIITSANLTYKAIGTAFVLVSDEFANGDIVTNPALACSENGLTISNGLSPSLRWANEPGSTFSYMLFMQDMSMAAISQGEIEPLFIYLDPAFYPTIATQGGFTIDNTPLICDNFRCRAWGISNITLNFPANYIPLGGINSSLVGDAGSEVFPFVNNFLVGANLFNYSIRAFQDSNVLSNLTKVATVSASQTLTNAATTTSGGGYGYYGPCAPIGAGTRRYQIDLLAMREEFFNVFWRYSGNTQLPATARSGLPGISIPQDTLSQLSVQNFRYYFEAPTNITAPDTTVINPPALVVMNVPNRGVIDGDGKQPYYNPRLGPDKTTFFRQFFDITTHSQEQSLIIGGVPYWNTETGTTPGGGTDVVSMNYVAGAANLQFYFKDVGCELCRFCSIGSFPANAFYDLWENYGNASQSSYSSVVPYDPQLPNKKPPIGLLNNNQSSDNEGKMSVLPPQKLKF